MEPGSFSLGAKTAKTILKSLTSGFPSGPVPPHTRMITVSPSLMALISKSPSLLNKSSTPYSLHTRTHGCSGASGIMGSLVGTGLYAAPEVGGGWR
jgi:hypothetical protein